MSAVRCAMEYAAIPTNADRFVENKKIGHSKIVSYVVCGQATKTIWQPPDEGQPVSKAIEGSFSG